MKVSCPPPPYRGLCRLPHPLGPDGIARTIDIRRAAFQRSLNDSFSQIADCHSLPQTAKYGIPFPAPLAETYDLRFRYLFVHVALL